MFDYNLCVAILALPFSIFIINGLLGSRLRSPLPGIIGTIGMLVSFLLSLMTAYSYFYSSPSPQQYKALIVVNFEWLRFTEHLCINLGILLDPISVMMLVVVSGVSLMVHIYSLGYMKGDPGFARYYSFLSLFSFSMLGLVVATNIFQMYMFWELVGVSSYLLIGYYYDKDSAVRAAKKAFIVTRFADLGFLIGLLLLSYQAESFDFLRITDTNGLLFQHSVTTSFIGMSVTTWALILIFIGGAGKSAMFPLHIWLPDAMEGPTPVSALIHAATMVVAGVYLVARLFPIYAIVAPTALEVVAWVGGASSLFAAIIACTQTDIKRVLAYSTMSQIGYMMLALGVSGYGAEHGHGFTASMFHLFTHAMFKALLFLCAGAVIHAVHSNEMKDMGGLRRYLPLTHLSFLVACFAIAGIPPFAGFFSKDEILAAAYEKNILLFVVEYIVAGLTAFYMFRLYFRIFWHTEQTYAHTPHEGSAVMTVPLILLAVASATTGFIPFGSLITTDGTPIETHIQWTIASASVGIAIAGILLARWMYQHDSSRATDISTSVRWLYTLAYRKFLIDEAYEFVTKKIIFQRIAHPIAWFDRHVVDASMNGIAASVNLVSDKTKTFQSGQLQWYASVFVCAVVALVLVFAYMAAPT